MFDLNQFEKLKESNQLEVKQSVQGIPNSIWETYSVCIYWRKGIS